MGVKRICRVFALWVCLCANAAIACANTYDIGGGSNDYPSMSALLAATTPVAGDFVNIYPGVYYDSWILSGAQGTELNPITIRGVDADGNPVASPQETVVFDYNGYLRTDGFAAINTTDSSAWITLQGIAIKNVTWDPLMGGAIKAWSSGTFVARYVLFKDNATNFQAKLGNDTAILEYCEFSGGVGGPYGSINHHQVYSIRSGHLIIQHCYFHDYDSKNGATIKSRDNKVDILYNYIEMGTTTAAIDAPQNESTGIIDQDTNVVGNVIIKRADDGDGWAQSFIHHSYDDQVTPRPGNVRVINNTFVDLTGVISGAFNFNTGENYTNEVKNNIFYGISDMTSAGNDDVLSGSNNWIPEGVSQDGLAGTLFGIDPGFAGNGDYRPASNSATVDSGTSGISITPSWEYAGVAGRKTRQLINGFIDVGAYEYEPPPGADTHPPAPPAGLNISN